jgi:hypothetical protein
MEIIGKQLNYGRTSHSTFKSDQRKQLEAEIMGNPQLSTLIAKMYFYDFTIFGFPFPKLNQEKKIY